MAFIFYRHPQLEGQHAFLGASKYYWINKTEDEIVQSYIDSLATQRGTRLHAFASDCINLKQKLPKRKITLNMFVNDAIGYGMNSEQVLYYSDNCFGTADAISFDGTKLRIHDLKTGKTPASMHQLEIYAALFCLEYKVKPGDIQIELRLYQSDEIIVGEPNAEIIVPIMDKIISYDKIINKIKEEEL